MPEAAIPAVDEMKRDPEFAAKAGEERDRAGIASRIASIEGLIEPLSKTEQQSGCRARRPAIFPAGID
jgi:hypothetical protein